MEGGFEIDDSLDSVDLDDIGSCLAKHYQEGKLHYIVPYTDESTCYTARCLHASCHEKNCLLKVNYW